MTALLFPILFPPAVSFLPRRLVRKALVPICLLVTCLDRDTDCFRPERPLPDGGMLLVEHLIALCMIYLSIVPERYLSVVLVAVRSHVMALMELLPRPWDEALTTTPGAGRRGCSRLRLRGPSAGATICF